MSDPASSANSKPSLWDSKPWWCQPWSIVLTGLAVPAASWWAFHQLWFTAPLVLGVLLWWWLFLVIAPTAYSRGDFDAVPPGPSDPSS